MEKSVTKSAKSVEEAIALAMEELGISEDDALIEVLEEGGVGGFLGIGKKSATVKVTATIDENASENEDTVYYGDDESFEGDAIGEAEDQAVSFVAEILSGIGIHGKLDSYREGDTIFIRVTGQDCGAAIGRRSARHADGSGARPARSRPRHRRHPPPRELWLAGAARPGRRPVHEASAHARPPL